jgi:hypothetical protein
MHFRKIMTSRARLRNVYGCYRSPNNSLVSNEHAINTATDLWISVVLDQYFSPLHCTLLLPPPRQVFISLTGNTQKQETDDKSAKENIQHKCRDWFWCWEYATAFYWRLRQDDRRFLLLSFFYPLVGLILRLLELSPLVDPLFIAWAEMK